MQSSQRHFEYVYFLRWGFIFAAAVVVVDKKKKCGTAGCRQRRETVFWIKHYVLTILRCHSLSGSPSFRWNHVRWTELSICKKKIRKKKLCCVHCVWFGSNGNAACSRHRIEPYSIHMLYSLFYGIKINEMRSNIFNMRLLFSLPLWWPMCQK